MKIATSRFGEIEINDELIFNFIEPILGYENLTKFALIDNQPESPFKWLQSMEDGDLAFPVTFPAYFGIDYKFVVPEEKSKKLEVETIDDIITFNIACIPQGNVKGATVNLVGPIVINAKNKKGMQLVLANTKFTVKHKLFNEDLKKEQPKKEKEETKQK